MSEEKEVKGKFRHEQDTKRYHRFRIETELPDWQKRRVPPGIGPFTHVLMPWADKWSQFSIPQADLLPSNPLF